MYNLQKSILFIKCLFTQLPFDEVLQLKSFWTNFQKGIHVTREHPNLTQHHLQHNLFCQKQQKHASSSHCVSTIQNITYDISSHTTDYGKPTYTVKFENQR